ncbi:MAG: hypothetical protein RLZ97_723 [Verrucomicrobiota bacterium]
MKTTIQDQSAFDTQRRHVAALMAALPLLTVASPVNAAPVTWGAPFNFDHTDETLFLNGFDPSRNGGVSAPETVTLDAAVDFGNTSLPNTTLNGITLTKVSGSTDFWGNTGIDPDIDAVLSGHVASAGTYTLNLTGLTIGRIYQIQLIGIHDSRGSGINQRQYEVSFGGSDYTSGGTPPVLTRAGYGNTAPPSPPTIQGFVSYGTVVGTFTADATTQSIQLRSNTLDGNTGDDPDPGLGGYILHSSAPSSGQPALTAAGVDSITTTSAQAYANLFNANATVTLYHAGSDYGTNLVDWQTNGTANNLGNQVVGPVEGSISGLTADTRYFTRFHAVNTAAEPDLEGWSAPMSFATALSGKSVTDLAATPFSAYEIDLTWTDNFDTETGYIIERSPAGAGSWTVVATVPADDQFHTDVHTGLIPGTSYDYRIFAVNGAGESDASNLVSATTSAATPITTDVLVNFDGSVSGTTYTLGAEEIDVTGSFKANGSPLLAAGVATINSGAGGGTAGFDFNPISIGDLRARNWIAETLITFQSFAGTLPTAISVQDVDFRINNAKTALEAVYYNLTADVRQTTPLPAFGTRVHLALVWDASTGTLNGYVDGNPIGAINGGAFEQPDATNVSFGYFGRVGFDNRGIDGILDAVSFRSGTATFNPATDFAILPTGSSFGGWITGFGLSSEDLGFDADPDLDGIPSGVEAFFGTSPNSPGTGITNVSTTGNVTTFTHPQADPQLDDVTSSYEWSTDLVNWYDGDGADGPGGGLTVSIPAVTPVAGVATVTATSSQPTPRLFVRVRSSL